MHSNRKAVAVLDPQNRNEFGGGATFTLNLIDALQEILSAPEVSRILHGAFLVISWLLRLHIVVAFIDTVLALFDGSRNAAERLARQFAELVGGVFGAIFDYLPDLFTAIIIIGIAYGVQLSLGSTSAVANGVAGIVITCTRAFKVGDGVSVTTATDDEKTPSKA
ncbi:MAG: mechanosensitive ion channel [Xanthomonadales bacterium]